MDAVAGSHLSLRAAPGRGEVTEALAVRLVAVRVGLVVAAGAAAGGEAFPAECGYGQ